MKLINDYFDLQEQIYRYFSYEHSWLGIPFDKQSYRDTLNYYWHLSDDTANGVYFCRSKEELGEVIANGADFGEVSGCHRREIYTRRGIPKWVFAGEDYTMICVYSDFENRILPFLQIFDNNRRVWPDSGSNTSPSGDRLDSGPDSLALRGHIPWYEVLGVSQDASEEVIKAVTKAMQIKTHSDTGGRDEEFLRIQSALKEAKDEKGF